MSQSDDEPFSLDSVFTVSTIFIFEAPSITAKSLRYYPLRKIVYAL